MLIKQYLSGEEIASFSNSFSAVVRPIVDSVSLSKLTLETNEIHTTGLFNNQYHEIVY